MLKIESLLHPGAPLAEYDGYWIPARPERFHSIGAMCIRLWAVFRGRAEAVQWPDQRGEPIEWARMTKRNDP